MNNFMFLYGETIGAFISLAMFILMVFAVIWVFRKLVYPWMALAWREYGPEPRSQKTNSTVLSLNTEPKPCLISLDGKWVEGYIQADVFGRLIVKRK